MRTPRRLPFSKSPMIRGAAIRPPTVRPGSFPDSFEVVPPGQRPRPVPQHDLLTESREQPEQRPEARPRRPVLGGGHRGLPENARLRQLGLGHAC